MGAGKLRSGGSGGQRHLGLRRLSTLSACCSRHGCPLRPRAASSPSPSPWARRASTLSIGLPKVLGDRTSNNHDTRTLAARKGHSGPLPLLPRTLLLGPCPCRVPTSSYMFCIVSVPLSRCSETNMAAIKVGCCLAAAGRWLSARRDPSSSLGRAESPPNGAATSSAWRTTLFRCAAPPPPPLPARAAAASRTCAGCCSLNRAHSDCARALLFVPFASGSRRGAEKVPKSRVALKRSFRIPVVKRARVNFACGEYESERGCMLYVHAGPGGAVCLRFAVILAILSVGTRQRKPRCARCGALRAACRPGQKVS